MSDLGILCIVEESISNLEYEGAYVSKTFEDDNTTLKGFTVRFSEAGDVYDVVVTKREEGK